MGILKNLTSTPEGIALIVLIVIVFGTLIMWLVIGAAIFAIIAVIFWQTLLPGILLFFGISMILYGAAKSNMKFVWVGFGLFAVAIGIAVWAG